MEIQIELSYKGKTRNASLNAVNIDNATMVKMVNSVCSVLHQSLVAETGKEEDPVSGMKWSISWNK